MRMNSKETSNVGMEIKNVSCDQCPKMFPRRSDLNKHTRTVHEKIKRYKCEKCSFWFSQNKLGQNHHERKSNLRILVG